MFSSSRQSAHTALRVGATFASAVILWCLVLFLTAHLASLHDHWRGNGRVWPYSQVHLAEEYVEGAWNPLSDVLFLLDGGVDPYHPTSVRASMGTIFWKPIIQTSFNEFMDWSRRGGYQRIATSAHATQDYREMKPNAPWILVLGSEQKGLSMEQLKACDLSVSLPMRGRASSLNLAVAAGILLYQFASV